MALDPLSIRRQFPILAQSVGGQPLTYLDTAATAQKPKAVIDALTEFYEKDNANAHRGMHVLAERATVAQENARGDVRDFLGAARAEEIVFTRGTTESINLVAKTWGRSLTEDDCIALTRLEHHSNIVPWLQLHEETGTEIRWIDCDDEGQIAPEAVAEALRDGRVKLLAITAQSNVLGTRPRLREIVRLAHGKGALVLVDAAQAAAHGPLDVSKDGLNCDFLALSAHKVYGPTGAGALYARLDLLREMPPFLGGGMMIENVREEGFTTADPPYKFEAGTQSVADIVGFAAGLRWLQSIPPADLAAHERMLIAAILESLRTVRGLRVLGPADAEEVHGCVSFVIDGVHPHDLTELLGRRGICLRAGHHCAQPLHRRLGITASTRVSVGAYNTVEEIALLPDAIEKAVSVLQR